MGLFSKLFNKPYPKGTPQGFFQTLTAYAPIYQSWNGALYESELVRAAIHTTASHISKLQVSVSGSAKPKLQTKIKAGANVTQTWSQFLYRLATILEMQNTAFIVPVTDDYGEMSGYYPILPSMCEILQYSGEPWLKYTFQNGNTAYVELKKCGIMTKFQYEDDYFGESNAALTSTMELMNIQNQGIIEGVKNSSFFRFIASYDNFANDTDLANEQKRFNNTALKEGGGVLLFPHTYKDIKQITSTPFVIDDKQMELIRTNVNNYFGVNEDVLQNKAYGDTWNAFYEGKIEPFVIQLQEVLTRMTFSERERAAGSKINVYSSRLESMSTADKINMATQFADRGFLMIDEIRSLFDLPPLPDNAGTKIPIRGEYYFTNDNDNNNSANGGGEVNESDGQAVEEIQQPGV